MTERAAAFWSWADAKKKILRLERPGVGRNELGLICVIREASRVRFILVALMGDVLPTGVIQGTGSHLEERLRNVEPE